jgi:hypothetical protein
MYIHPPALALQFLKTHSLIFTDDFTPIKIAAPFEVSDFGPSNKALSILRFGYMQYFRPFSLKKYFKILHSMSKKYRTVMIEPDEISLLVK